MRSRITAHSRLWPSSPSSQTLHSVALPSGAVNEGLASAEPLGLLRGGEGLSSLPPPSWKCRSQILKTLQKSEQNGTAQFGVQPSSCSPSTQLLHSLYRSIFPFLKRFPSCPSPRITPTFAERTFPPTFSQEATSCLLF